jgi:uncharacterized protein involved in exopolysaccharide biosynthesis
MESGTESHGRGGGMSPDRLAAPTTKDAVAFLRRRRLLFMFVAIPIFCLAVIIAFRLPAIYLSEAKVLIEQPAIPEDIVASTVNTYVDEQIEAVSQRVLAQQNVTNLIEEFDLYPQLRTEGINLSVVTRFRADTDLDNIAAEIFDARRGRMDGSTFAFVVGYRYSDPIIAQQVADRLIKLYLAENVKSRTELSAETTTFLRDQAERVAEDISQIEQKLSDFKAQYAGALPERLSLNVQLLDRFEREIARIDDEVRQQSNQRDILRSELQSLNPYATMVSETGAPVLGAEERLEGLRLEYARQSSTYGPEHPDVIRTKREIDAILGSESLQSEDELALRLAALRIDRAQLLERYSAQHPDVLKLDRTIATLEVQQAEAGSGGGTRMTSAPAPNNPIYIQKQLQIDGINERLRAAQSERRDLVSRRDEAERNIAIAPTVEREWLALNRGYSSLQDEYDQINRRISEAQMSETLESQNMGERFTILEAATLPTDPVEPNRSAIIFLGVVVALGLGVGLSAIVDGLDSSVRSGRDLEVILGVSPLITIPFVETVGDTRLRRIKQASILALIAVSIASVILTV